jgi:group I intron endonuclease
MGCGIYKIVNLLDNKVYIGSSISIEKREYKHFWMLNRGTHDNNNLQNSFNRDGKDNFKFTIVEECDVNKLIERENYFINEYESNNSNYGYNLAKVNDFRRNTFNDEVKVKISKHYLTKNGNFTIFSLTNIITEEVHIFDSLVDGANYLIDNGFAKGNPRNVRIKLSSSLRGVVVNNGKKNNGSIRKTCYKHNFKIIN